MPFGVLPSDLDMVVGAKQQTATTHDRECSSIIYVGAGGPIMQRSFGFLCRVLASARAQVPTILDGIALELLGTHFGWREGDPRHLAETAEANGVGCWVQEDPGRVTYRGSLETLLDADGALILGVEDDGYMPSKLFSYAWSGKPLLAVLRRQSPAYALFAAHPSLGHALWFDREDEMPLAEAVVQVKTFLAEVKARQIFDRRGLLSPYTAAEMAHRHAELFEQCASVYGS